MIWIAIVLIIVLLISYLLAELATIQEVRDLKKHLEDIEEDRVKWNSTLINGLAANTADIVDLKKDHDQIQKNTNSIMANMKQIFRIGNQQVKDGRILDHIWRELAFPVNGKHAEKKEGSTDDRA